jgi:hypothetical protein
MSISGYATAAMIGGMSPVLVPGVQSIDVEHEAAKLDGATAEDEGFTNDDDGLHSLVVTCDLVMDITAGTFVAIKPGTLITDFKVFADLEATTPLYHMPVCKVFRSTWKGEVNGRSTYRCTINNKGPFTVNEPN